MEFYSLLFIKGILIGFAIAMPVGPIGVLCIQHTLTRGRLQGFVAGLGAAFADTIYGAVAAFGVSSVGDFLDTHSTLIKAIAAAYLLFIGLRMLYTEPPKVKEEITHAGLFKTFMSTCLLTLANPFTLLAFGVVFALFGIGIEATGTCPACAVVFGVIVGSSCWWLLLSSGAAFIGKRMTEAPMQYLSRTSGSIMLVFAALATISLIKDFIP